MENAIDKIDKQTLRNYSVEEIKNVINKIQKLHDGTLMFGEIARISYKLFVLDVLTVEISEKILTHPLIEEEMTKPELGDKSRKHLIQTSSILGYLKEYDLIKSDTCFIEFGAGKGILN